MTILFKKSYLTINTELARVIGLNQAIILQQIHFWLREKKNLVDGKYWVYNSITQWQKQFPFFSESTIKRTFKTLKNIGVIVVGEYNKDKRDKTNWYSINYEKLTEIAGDALTQHDALRRVRTTRYEGAKCTDIVGQNESSITKEVTKTTSKNTTKINQNTIGVTSSAKLLAADFIPIDAHYDLARRLCLNIDNELPHFKDHHHAKGSKMRDWNAAFNLWLRNAAKFSQISGKSHQTLSERNRAVFEAL